MNSDFDDEDYELRWMRKLAKATGRPVWFLLTDRYEDPERWRRLLTAVRAARSEGLSLTAQIAGRPIGVMMGIGTALNPFTVRPSYKALEGLPIEEQRTRLRDPELRRRILAEKPSDAEVAKLAQFRQLVTKRWDKFFTMGDPPDYEPGPELSVAAIAVAPTTPMSGMVWSRLLASFERCCAMIRTRRFINRGAISRLGTATRFDRRQAEARAELQAGRPISERESRRRSAYRLATRQAET
jgi:N-acyl-D-aspartate/D-glutamate deacylase